MPFILLAIIAAIIGAATIIEHFTGTPHVHEIIYDALWFKFLWGFMSIAAIWMFCRRKLWKRPSIFLLHLSFLIILTGALVTSLFAEKGILHIRTGATASAFMTKDKHFVVMPFTVRLDSFAIDFHPGTKAPADYTSYITCLNKEGKEIKTGRISMNNILKLEDYRLYQTSYDKDLQGTILSANHDPWGIRITYLGYLLLAISAILTLYNRKSWSATILKQIPHTPKNTLALSAMAIIFVIAITNATITSDTSASGRRQLLESLYSSIPYSKILFCFNLTFGLILLSVSLYFPQAYRRISNYTKAILYTSTLFISIIYIMRWYIGGRIPLANGHETMLFLAMATLCTSCIVSRSIHTAIPLGLIISGLALLVSHLAQMSTRIDNLTPVLQSPLLSIHVSVIMIAYTLFAFMALNGAASLVLMRKQSGHEQARRLTLISRIMLYPATLLLAIGIFIGAIWANVSWGNYWSWDPKEVWALITMIVYGIAFHDTSIKWLRSDRYFNIYIALASLTVLMTYFGVNYLLGGMHSYA